MLKQACISEIRSGRIGRKDGYIVIAMQKYPRGLKKELRDEYIRALAPDAKLLNDFHAFKEKLDDHNAAFNKAEYENRFELSKEAVDHLRRLSELSRERDVYLVCQCDETQRCHRELLVLLAHKWFSAPTAPTRFKYPVFIKSMPKIATA